MVWGGGGYWRHSANPGDDTSSSKDKGVHIRLDYKEKHFFKYPIVEFAVKYG